MNYESIKIIKGKEKIILSAPHSVLHMRENAIRPKEIRTADIVKKLATKGKVYSIYKMKIMMFIGMKSVNIKKH